MPSAADAAAQVQAAGLPVLFIDTCSLVDVIRAPIRPEKLRGCVEAAAELLQLVTTPQRATLVVASFISLEWHTHAPATRDELTKHLGRLDEWAISFHDACAFVGIAPAFGRPVYASAGLADALFDLSGRLLQSAVCLDPHNDTNMRAFQRAVTHTPPSQKGGEIKDSTIVEECLEVCRLLHAASFPRKRVFCTSNTDDYCDATKALHPSLDADFRAVGLVFTKELPWALHELKT
jgi:hypothetical protein